MEQATVLIVDDEKHTREGLRLSLEDDYDVYIASDRAEALEVLKNEKVDVMVTDLRLGADDGMELIGQALTMPYKPVVIMMTAYGSVDTAVEAMKRGAYHFVTKPLNIEELDLLIKRALRSRTLEQENVFAEAASDRTLRSRPHPRSVGAHEACLRNHRSSSSQPGHRAHRRRERHRKGTRGPCPPQSQQPPQGQTGDRHCAALSPSCWKASSSAMSAVPFTGALERRIGRFETADGGTLFLDEIGEIDQATR